jgi:N-acetylated-alpha-linked acidic dipeptidase
MGSDAGPTDAVYHYHSNYDSFHWMTTYGDPEYLYHKAIGQYISLLTYQIANTPLLPLDFANYGVEMSKYLTILQNVTDTANANSSSPHNLDLSELEEAIEIFNASAASLTQYIATADLYSATELSFINGKIRDYQRGFTSQGGLPTRTFYQNVVFAPGLDTGYAPVTWPGITEAITEYKDWEMAEEWVGRSARAVTAAAGVLAV